MYVSILHNTIWSYEIREINQDMENEIVKMSAIESFLEQVNQWMDFHHKYSRVQVVLFFGLMVQKFVYLALR